MMIEHKKVVILVGLVVFLSVLAPTKADIDITISTSDLGYYDDCYNGSHLLRTTLFNITNETSDTSEYKIETFIYCPWNCSGDVNECAPKPYMRSIYLIGIFLFLVFVLIVLFKLGRR